MVFLEFTGMLQVENISHGDYMYPGTTNSLEVIQCNNYSLKTSGVQSLFTTRNDSQSFVPIMLVIELTAVSSLITVCTLSFGSNASCNNVMAATLLAGLTGLNSTIQLPINSSVITTIPANTSMGINVTIPAIASTYSGNIFVIGFYR